MNGLKWVVYGAAINCGTVAHYGYPNWSWDFVRPDLPLMAYVANGVAVICICVGFWKKD